MANPKCEDCGSSVDVTPDGTHGHCATCNNVCIALLPSYSIDLRVTADLEGRSSSSSKNLAKTELRHATANRRPSRKRNK